MALAEDHKDARRFGLIERFTAWRNRIVADPKFQRWASRFPLTKRVVRRDGERLFDLVAGFVYSQTLYACVELDLFERLSQRPQSAEALALDGEIPVQRMATLCDAAASLGLLTKMRDGRYALARLGAAFRGVPGLDDMVRHHEILFRDLSDPIGLLKGDRETELARFWPYVLDEKDAAASAEYSKLMEVSQALVAQETLAQVTFSDAHRLLDVGGGTGAFLRAVAAEYDELELSLLDLPDVVTCADTMGGRIHPVAGSFRDPLPTGADMISLIRVLYDHSDETIRVLLRRVFEALPSGGRLLISEPMSGGAISERSTDAYFAFYTMAMRTGQVRSAERITELLHDQGFVNVRSPQPDRPFVTRVLTARKA